MKKLIYGFVFLASIGIAFVSCEKNSIEYDNEIKEVNEANGFVDDLDSRIKISPEDMEYMNSLPDYNPKELALALEETTERSSKNRSTEEVWGIGTGRTVWKWNGTSWGQPNPAARLYSVEVAKNGDDSVVWGIGTGGTVWKWNGASWGQPNPAARLSLIAVHSSNIAFGIAWDDTLFITINGGQNWAHFTDFQNAYWISCGDYYNIFSVSDLSGNLYKYNLGTDQLDPVTGISYVSTHATTYGGSIWATQLYSNRVFRSINFTNFIEPNSNVFLYEISSNIPDRAWAVGPDRRVWKTTNSGASWFQPNSAARLDYISAAW